MSNPHPHKQSHYGDAMSPRMKAKFATYSPRIRAVNEALPGGVNLFTQPVYQPERMEPVRSGADDHLRYASWGTGT
jgi:hypothetical protein